MATQANVNDYVSVVLTPEAERIWAEYWTYARMQVEGKPGVPDSCRHITPEGRTLFQLHELMLIFGQQMYNGNPKQMFKDNAIWYER